MLDYNESLPVLALVENDDNENISIKYFKEDGTEIQTDPTAVGKYYAVVKYNGNNNYKELAEERINITINALDADFSIVGDLTKVYDGQPLTVSIDKNLEVEYKYYQTDDAYENKVALPEGTYPINAGKYIVQVIFEGNDVFNATSIEQRLLIDYASTTITVKFNDEVVTDGESIEITYKEIYTITAEVANGNNQYVDIVYTTHDNNKPYYCGEYNIHVNYVEDPNYGEIRFRFNLIITPADLDIIMETEQTVIYNGLEHEIEASLNVDDTQIILIEYYINEEWRSDVLPVDAGTYKFRVTAGGTATNYNELVKEGTLIITPGEFNTVVKLYDKTVTYDGNNQTLEISGQLEEGLSVSYEYYLGEEKLNTLPVNAGVYTVKAILVSNSPNHIDKVLTATLTIEKADITEDNISNVGLPQYISVDYVPGMTVSDVLTKLTEKHLVPTDATMILKSGSNTIEVTYESKNYNDYTYDFEIRCKAHIEEIIVEELGKQFIGKSFDINNIIVVEKYNDTTEKEINITLENLVTDIATIDTNGVFTVVITYIEKEYSVTVTPVEAPQLMIYAAYGAGGLANAAYDRDFVVLYNNSAEAFDLTGYSVQTFSSSGGKKSIIPLTGTIPGYGFYTIASNEVGTNGSVLPFGETANINNYKIDLAQDKFIVCLSNSTTQIVLGDFTNYVDIVGVNGTYFEGTATAPAIDKTSYIKRISFTEDSNDNSIDFVKESFTSNSFDFLKDGYVAYFNAKEHIASQNKDFTKIEDELTFTVLTESVGRTISWKAYENEVETQMVKIVGNVVTATPIQLETHSIVLRGTVEGTDLTIEITLNLSNLEQLPTFELSINEDKLRVEWAQVGAATSYDIYVDSELVYEKTTIYENNYYELTSVNKNANIKVVAKGPEGYLPSEATIDFEYQEIMQRRIVYTLNEASAVFKESYSLAGDFTITLILAFLLTDVNS